MQLLLSSCAPSSQTKKIVEGRIVYNISFPKEVTESSIGSFLPQSMIAVFKDSSFKYTFCGTLSIYSLDIISNSSEDSSNTLFRFLNQKLFVPTSNTTPVFIYKEYMKNSVELIPDSTKQIAGFPCEMAIIHFDNNTHPAIKVYYTKQIQLNNPNDNTPFKNIPGVMMEFELVYNNLPFKFIAQEIFEGPVELSEFIIPSEYRKTTSEEIESIMNSLLE